MGPNVPRLQAELHWTSNKPQILKTINLIGKAFLVFLTGLLTFVYLIALFEKIQRPNFKNLPKNDFIIFGILLLLLILINLKWVFGFFKTR